MARNVTTFLDEHHVRIELPKRLARDLHQLSAFRVALNHNLHPEDGPLPLQLVDVGTRRFSERPDLGIGRDPDDARGAGPIALADMRERIRKLEAIANGVDL